MGNKEKLIVIILEIIIGFAEGFTMGRWTVKIRESGNGREKGMLIIGAILYIAAVGSIYFMWRGE